LHWLRVRAIDAQGNVDQSPARADWMLDLSPPNTTLTSRTPRWSGNSVLTVSFAGKDAVAVASFECRLDKRPWRPCTSPFRTPRLKAGWHSIAVRAVDSAGHADPTPLKPTFKIDPSKAVVGQKTSARKQKRQRK
jgi:hypothetical protein